MEGRPMAIDVLEVSKRYRGKVNALQNVSLQVPRGEIYGLLGPNGAGKSTLLKILLTIIKPNRCRGVMLGHPIGHKASLAKVGYLPEHVRFPEYLTGRQVIRYSAGLSGICPKFCKKREEELLDFVGMTDWASKKVRTYSKGMKQRIGLAQALVNDPELVFLDEPTDGVDPQGRKEMRGVLQLLRDQGRTVFINSHLLGELEMVCDSAAILNQGKVVKQGRLSELTETSQSYKLSYEGHIGHELREQLGAVCKVNIENSSIELTSTDAEAMQPVIDLMRSHQIIIEEIVKEKQSLEDIFINAVKDRGEGGGV